MSVKTLNLDAINYINSLENFTRSKIKDCIITDDGLMFIVDSEFIGRVIGARGSNIRRIEERFKKRVKIIEFSNDVTKFVKNLIYPIRPRDIKVNDSKLEIKANDSRMKGQLLGRDRKNLKRLQELVSRYFNYNIEVL